MSALPPDVLRAAARARVSKALAHIQRAQNELNEACSELSALCGGATVWRATGKASDRVRALWYRVDALRQGGRYYLDSISVQAMEQRAQQS